MLIPFLRLNANVMKKIDCPNFILGEKLNAEQLDFFDKHGVIIFRNFIPKETVQLFISETQRIEKQWIDEGREKINGVPLKFGKDEKGNKIIQRMCFLSLYSDPFHQLLQDPRIAA